MEKNDFKTAGRRFSGRVYRRICNILNNEFMVHFGTKIITERKEDIALKNKEDVKQFARCLEKYVAKKAKSVTRKNGDPSNITPEKYSTTFKSIYESICRTILNNISTTNYVKNNSLVYTIINGALSSKEIAVMAYERPQALFPQVNKQYYDFFNQQDQVSFERGDNLQTTIKCKKCHSYSCIASQAQTSCSDEAMTTYITCLNCGYVYRS